MRLSILENTYIRSNPHDEGEPLGVLYSGTIVQAEEHPIVGAEPAYGNGTGECRWYRDAVHDWYYWAGSTRPLDRPAPPPVLPDYRAVFPLPDSWRRTQGRGIPMAVVDTGFDFGHPGLAPYRRAGHCYNLSTVSRSQRYAGNGTDSVAPDRPGDYHGTECAGILAGLAPEAELYFFKVQENRLTQLLEVLSIARAKGIRLVSVSLAYDDIFRLGDDYAELRALFTRAQQELGSTTLLISAINNPQAHLELLNQVPFPASWKPLALAVGALDAGFLSKFPQKPGLSPAIDLLTVYGRPFPVVASGGKIRETAYSSSYAAAFLCAMLGLGAAAASGIRDSSDVHLLSLFQALAQQMIPYAQAAQTVAAQQKICFVNPKI
jgi:hypothetical protein